MALLFDNIDTVDLDWYINSDVDNYFLPVTPVEDINLKEIYYEFQHNIHKLDYEFEEDIYDLLLKNDDDISEVKSKVNLKKKSRSTVHKCNKVNKKKRIHKINANATAVEMLSKVSIKILYPFIYIIIFPLSRHQVMYTYKNIFAKYQTLTKTSSKKKVSNIPFSPYFVNAPMPKCHYPVNRESNSDSYVFDVEELRPWTPRPKPIRTDLSSSSVPSPALTFPENDTVVTPVTAKSRTIPRKNRSMDISKDTKKRKNVSFEDSKKKSKRITVDLTVAPDIVSKINVVTPSSQMATVKSKE